MNPEVSVLPKDDLEMRLSERNLLRSLQPTVILRDEEARQALARGAAAERLSVEALAIRIGNWQELTLVRLPDSPRGIIGEGGQARVYSYVQRELGREVAVKTLKSGKLAFEAVENLVREACVTARLEHPNIIPVHYLHLPEHGGDAPYWVMKRIRGRPLAAHLPGGKDPWAFRRLLEVLRRVLDAMAFAHSRGIIHRDLKPDNVLVGAFGEVQVMDWGLAVAVTAEGAGGAKPVLAEEVARGGAWIAEAPGRGTPELPAEIVRLNRNVREGRIGALAAERAGGLAGTPAYMAPEQMQETAEGITERTDVFLLGGLLYAILTGGSPHALPRSDGPEGWMERLVAILECSTIAVPTARRRALGFQAAPEGISSVAMEELCALVMKALAPNPEDRFGSVRDMAEALIQWEAESASAELCDRAAARYEDGRSGREDPARAYAEAIGLANAALDKVGTNLAATEVRDRAAAALTAIEQRVAEAERQVRDERDHAVREAYFAGIPLALKRFEDGNVGEARSLLDRCPASLRNWEWGRVKHLCCQDLMTVQTRQMEVWCIALCPDGKWIASGGGDGSICGWEADTAKELFRLAGHRAGVDSLVIVENGKRIITGCSDGTIRIWDVAARRQVKVIEIPGHVGYILVAANRDGRHVAAALEKDPRVHIFDVDSGNLARSLAGHIGVVKCVAWSPDGKTVASGGGYGDGAVILWNAQSGTPRLTLRVENPDDPKTPPPILALAFDPEGKRIAAWSQHLRIWDAVTGQPLLDRRGDFTPYARSMAFSPDGKRLAMGRGNNIYFLNPQTGEEMFVLKGHGAMVGGIAFSPDGQRIASGSGDGTVKLWDAGADRQSGILWNAYDPANAWTGPYGVAFSPDGRRLAASAEGAILVFDPAERREVMKLDGHQGGIPAVAYSRDGKRIASGGSGDKTVKIWDAQTGRMLFDLREHEGELYQVTWSPDGTLFSRDENGIIKVWDTQSGRSLNALTEGRRERLSQLAPMSLSRDGKRLAAGMDDGTVLVWDVEKRSLSATLGEKTTGRGRVLQDLVFSPDGRRIAAACRDNIVRVFDLDSGSCAMELRGHTDVVSRVAFSPDGKRIVSGDVTGMLRLWDAENGRELLAWPGHKKAVYSLAFSPDGRTIASAGLDQTLRLWETTAWESGRLGDWEIGRLGNWESGRVGD